MKRVLIYIFLLAAVAVPVFFFRSEAINAVTFLYSRPNRDLTDQELDARIAAVGAELAVLQGKYHGLPSDLKERSLSEHATGRELMEQSEGPLQQWRSLRTEKAWRSTSAGLVPYAALLASAIVFLETARRLMHDRDPRAKRRLKFQSHMERELARERGARSDQSMARRAEAVNAVDPRLAGLKPGSSTRQDVINLLGQPHERTVFLEYEAWIYHLPSPAGTVFPRPEGGPESAARPEPGPGSPPGFTPVTLLFSGNLVHDLSIGTIRDQKDMRRIL